MTNLKDSALTSITGAGLADGDLFRVVDVSDTTMAASGTNKKITKGELASVLGTNIDASYVFTGFLPFGKIDATGRSGHPTLFGSDANAWDGGSGYLGLDLSAGNVTMHLETDNENAGSSFFEIFLVRSDNANREAKIYHGVDNSDFTNGLVFQAYAVVNFDEPTGLVSFQDYDSTGFAFNYGSNYASEVGAFTAELTGATGQTVPVLDVQTAGGSTSVFKATGDNKLGFFNATAAAKPTGVAVSAAGIHAALVTLGLIAA